MPQAVSKYLFLALLLIFCVTFFTRNNLRSVNEITPEALKPPEQTPLSERNNIHFEKSGYEYNLTPLYAYEINALVAGKMDYSFFSIYKHESVFPADLCLTWGSNLQNKVYKNRNVHFSQDGRWCWVNWSGNVNFNLQELSNNHLLINQRDLLGKLKSIARGDQVKIKGKLVNVKAKPSGSTESSEITWNSSTSREDSGAGACEVIYVEQIDILKKANVISRILFKLSFYGLLLMVLLSIFKFFFMPIEPR